MIVHSCLLLVCLVSIAAFHQLRPIRQINSRALSSVSKHAGTNSLFKLHSTTEPATSSEPLQEGEEGETEDEALIRRIADEVYAESGVDLDQLINPSKVVNLERDLVFLNAQLKNDATITSAEKEVIEATIEKKSSVLRIEKRSVMRGWLKGLFVGQSVLAVIASLAMVYDAVPGYHLDLSVKVLGFWMWWLFIIPSLRARKPKAQEKKALDIAFLASPLISFVLPFATKDVTLIWWANAVIVVGAYGVGYLGGGATPEPGVFGSSDDEDAHAKLQQVGWELPTPLVKIVKALDYGSGQERGARK